MSLFSWLFSKAQPPQTSRLHQDGSNGLASKSGSPTLSTDPMTDLKHQRHERREHLYDVVRSVMLRSEVLASHYKFKVLSLDTRGRQFLVMVDLLGEQVLPPDRWGPIEQLIALTAAQRHDLQVKAVYWRFMMPAVGAVAPTPAPVAAKPTPTPTLAPTPLAATAPVAPSPRGYEPINQDEVLAFKKAIAAATINDSTAPELGKVQTSGPRHPPPMPGYEDTQLLEPDDAGSPLSRTQFGGL
jgi:hypothetical protein